MRLRLWSPMSAIFAIGLCTGCAPAPYDCNTSADCFAAGVRGWCLPNVDGNSYCAGTDDVCPYGRRWHDSAHPRLALRCVDEAPAPRPQITCADPVGGRCPPCSPGEQLPCALGDAAPSSDLCQTGVRTCLPSGEFGDCQTGAIVCGVGACRRTVPTCHGGQPQSCIPGTPSAEVCGNGVDDDCDGFIDDWSVPCGGAFNCKANSACADGDRCTCLPGFHAVDCGGRDCPRGFCTGAWQCVR